MTTITVEQISELQKLRPDVDLDPSKVLAWPNPARFAVDKLCGAGTYDAIYRFPKAAKTTASYLAGVSDHDIKLLHTISPQQWTEMLVKSHEALSKSNHIVTKGHTAVLTAGEETARSVVTKVCEVVIVGAGAVAAIIVVVVGLILALLALPEVLTVLGITALVAAQYAVGLVVFAVISVVVLGGVALIAEVIKIIWG
jgi:hypothetical protein